MTCPDCTAAAQKWTWGGYRAGCADCQVRAIANAPRHIREIRYDQLRRELGNDAAQAVIARVKDEYQRIAQLKAAAQ